MSRRPVYESDSDRRKEKSFAAVIEEQWVCILKKSPPFYHIDFMGIDVTSSVPAKHRLEFFVEMKHRKINRDKYPTYMLSLKKWINMNLLRRFSGMPVYLTIRYLDVDVYLHVTDEVFPVSYMGRVDRGDESDMEPCIMVPIDRMIPLGGRPSA